MFRGDFEKEEHVDKILMKMTSGGFLEEAQSSGLNEFAEDPKCVQGNWKREKKTNRKGSN